MSETLLQTKLYVPPLRPNLVPRPRLVHRLNQGLHSGYKFSLISAPAGYGKTTLVAEWLASLIDGVKEEDPVRNPSSEIRNQFAWLSLEKSDNDFHRFLAYLVAALQTIDDSFGEGILAAFQSIDAQAVESILTTLLNQAAAFPDQLVFILDDYHLIESRPVHDAVSFLIEHLPPRLHLVMLTRVDPPFPLPLMRGRGELLEIRVRDLRFSAAETTTFLRDMAGMDLSEMDIQTLHTRTEGWIAGLQLAALAIRDRDNPSDLIAVFGSGHHYIVEYLVEEILDRQPESLRTFLLQTSILNRLTGSLCDALTERSDGDATLAWCVKSNLFVSPLAGEYGWYRYHALFADILARRLERLEPHQIPALHRRAAGWFREQRLFDEALRHGLAAGDYGLVAGIIESQAQELLHLGRLATLIAWLDALPAEIVRRRPRLSVDLAWVLLLTGKLEEIEGRLADAEKNLDDLDHPDELRGQIAAIRAYAAGRLGQLDRAIDQASIALEMLPEDDHSVRCVVAFVLGGIYQLRGDVPSALTHLRKRAGSANRSETSTWPSPL